jgi:hypothetical protein
MALQVGGSQLLAQLAGPVSVNIGKDEPSNWRYDEGGNQQATRSSIDAQVPWVSIGRCRVPSVPFTRYRAGGEEARPFGAVLIHDAAPWYARHQSAVWSAQADPLAALHSSAAVWHGSE